MSDTNPSSPAISNDRDIEQLLSGTARGRSFLADYARRMRAAETQRLLEAVARLERRLSAPPGKPETSRMEAELAELASFLQHGRAEIAATHGLASGAGLAELVTQAEQATVDVVDAAERIQETAWSLRESGFDAGRCDQLDRHATEIYRAAARQDATHAGLARMAELLAAVEARIGNLIRAGHPAMPTRARPPLEVDPRPPASDIDFVLRDLPGPPHDPASAETGIATTRELALAELARIQSLDIREKLKLFT
ncbi:hypothetical protein [Enterovirga sp.]|jgi:hypothetical protein|uniref:hypothetical protein n=1 Tax=Enterovirga sp. TaxID=2026350 RepID=UPI00262FA070|nr:hypothetical protein [Enterovirga sp.]MDB5591759.1 hypothetical protein [Enterovirga sp.]